jgi:hypothetical protein
VIDDPAPPERDARVLGSRHKICAMSGRPKEAEIRFPVSVTPCLGYELRNSLKYYSMLANGRLHTVSLLFGSMATPV